MLYKEKQIREWIDKNKCLSHYYQVYNWFELGKINETTWKYYCQNCIFEIENADILKIIKEEDLL